MASVKMSYIRSTNISTVRLEKQNHMKKLFSLSILVLVLLIRNSPAAEKYDIAAFYWPSLHYDERWAAFFPEGGKDGEWESIRNCKPKWEGHSHKRKTIWPGSVDLPTFKTVGARVIEKYWTPLLLQD